jgi:hypothetical protein
MRQSFRNAERVLLGTVLGATVGALTGELGLVATTGLAASGAVMEGALAGGVYGAVYAGTRAKHGRTTSRFAAHLSMIGVYMLEYALGGPLVPKFDPDVAAGAALTNG